MPFSQKKSAFIPRDWVEPVHNYHIEMYEVLVSLYRYIKETYQDKIDAAFNRVAKEIGFVVATSLPATVEISSKGVVKQVSFSAENLKGTIFERQVLNEALALNKDSVPGVRAGTYDIQLLWLEALKIKIKTDWMEPVHFRYFDRLFRTDRPELKPDVREPVHYYPELELDRDAQLLARVLDEVYPELNIAERIKMDRETMVRSGYYTAAKAAQPQMKRFEWMEPVHFQQGYYQDPSYRKVPYEVMEPVHFRRNVRELEGNVLTELAGLLKRYGY